MNKLILPFVIMAFVLILTSNVSALDINFHQDLTQSQKETFEKMSQPFILIYNMLKYFASIGGAIYLVIAGVNFMTAGADSKQRNEAKLRATGVILGLAIIWIAPMLVTIMMV